MTVPRQGYKPIYLSGDGGLAQDALINDPNIKGEYAAIYSFPYTDKSTPATKEFHKAMDKYAPKVLKGNSRQPATQIWTAAKAMEAVAGNITAANPTKEDVLKGLYALKDNDLDGLAPQPITFTEGAGFQPHITCYFTMQTKNHKLSSPSGMTPELRQVVKLTPESASMRSARWLVRASAASLPAYMREDRVLVEFARGTRVHDGALVQQVDVARQRERAARRTAPRGAARLPRSRASRGTGRCCRPRVARARAMPRRRAPRSGSTRTLARARASAAPRRSTCRRSGVDGCPARETSRWRVRTPRLPSPSASRGSGSRAPSTTGRCRDLRGCGTARGGRAGTARGG